MLRRQRGVTLVELMVVLLVLGLLGGMSVLAVGAVRRPTGTVWADTLRRARAAAIRSGQPVRLTSDGGGAIRLLPDGRALGEGVDPFTGTEARGVTGAATGAGIEEVTPAAR